jgi:GTP-binding protein LepA
VVDGQVAKGDTVVMMNTGKEYTLDEIGVLAPVKTPVSVSDFKHLKMYGAGFS